MENAVQGFLDMARCVNKFWKGNVITSYSIHYTKLYDCDKLRIPECRMRYPATRNPPFVSLVPNAPEKAVISGNSGIGFPVFVGKSPVIETGFLSGLLNFRIIV